MTPRSKPEPDTAPGAASAIPTAVQMFDERLGYRVESRIMMARWLVGEATRPTYYDDRRERP